MGSSRWRTPCKAGKERGILSTITVGEDAASGSRQSDIISPTDIDPRAHCWITVGPRGQTIHHEGTMASTP